MWNSNLDSLKSSMPILMERMEIHERDRWQALASVSSQFVATYSDIAKAMSAFSQKMLTQLSALRLEQDIKEFVFSTVSDSVESVSPEYLWPLDVGWRKAKRGPLVKLLDQLPNCAVKPIPSLNNSIRLETVSDKRESQGFQYDGVSISCLVRSTYPVVKEGQRYGDPIADSICAEVYSDCAIFCIGDGCGWGVSSISSVETNILRIFKKQKNIR